jgi:hypothetical protein
MRLFEAQLFTCKNLLPLFVLGAVASFKGHSDLNGLSSTLENLPP